MTVMSISMVIAAQNETNRPVVVIIANTIGVLKQFDLKISMSAFGAVLDQHAALSFHVTWCWSFWNWQFFQLIAPFKRSNIHLTWILLIVIVVLNDNSVLGSGIVVRLFWIETVPQLNLVHLGLATKVSYQHFVKVGAVPWLTCPQQIRLTACYDLKPHKKVISKFTAQFWLDFLHNGRQIIRWYVLGY